MIDNITIVCPHQQSEDFSIEKCYRCSSFTLNIGNKMSVRCSKQKARIHKLDFETAFFLHRLGQPYKVHIEAKQDNV